MISVKICMSGCNLTLLWLEKKENEKERGSKIVEKKNHPVSFEWWFSSVNKGINKNGGSRFVVIVMNTERIFCPRNTWGLHVTIWLMMDFLTRIGDDSITNSMSQMWNQWCAVVAISPLRLKSLPSASKCRFDHQDVLASWSKSKIMISMMVHIVDGKSKMYLFNTEWNTIDALECEKNVSLFSWFLDWYLDFWC